MATTTKIAGYQVKDFNEVKDNLHDQETFNFLIPTRGEDFDDRTKDDRLYHPVLYGERYRRKFDKMHDPITRNEYFRSKFLRGYVKIKGGQIPLLNR